MTIIKIFKRGWWTHHGWHPFKGKDKCYTITTVEHPNRMTAMKRATEVQRWEDADPSALLCAEQLLVRMAG